jgi:LysR family transcriptional activator of nhaA
MNPSVLNYRHLRYFWVTAQEGSFTRAAERLDVAVQTVSVQIGLLEQDLGAALLTPQGRRLVPTEAGRQALAYADEIFQLGERLREAVLEAGGKRSLRLTVGISDALPKLIAYRLLQPVRSLPEKLSLICHEGDFADLVADLALHRLDVVLTDRPAAVSGSLRVYSHSLGECEISLFGAPPLAERYQKNFPGELQGAPVLLPTRENALRGRLDQWFAANDLRLDLAGEFEDNALLTTFGGAGLGLFPAPAVLANDIKAQFGALPVGALSGVREQFYVISAERRIVHPAVEAIQAGAKGLL